ncbi:MAG: hypothetical protein MRY83_14650 [Flavobacteriales bacterium]|nr:hypothetical protein [Flavobacteriales bacterium]
MIQTELLNDLIRNKEIFIENSLSDKISKKDMAQLALSGLAFMMAFGFVIGVNHSILQGLFAAVKLPLLFLLTSAICFPTLYFFLAVLGIKQQAKELAQFSIICLVIMSVSLIAFSPISIFFVISTKNYLLIKAINILIFMVSGFIGLYFFYNYIGKKFENMQIETNKKRARLFIRGWLIMFAFIGCELSYRLSPFFGDPSAEFMMFTDSDNGFFLDFWETFKHLLL